MYRVKGTTGLRAISRGECQKSDLRDSDAPCDESRSMAGGHSAVMRAVALLTLQLAAAGPPPPKALLINLPRHEERYREVKTQLEGAGLEYERAEAVDGKMLTPEELKKDVTPLGRWLITRGMVGCFLSHRNCWQRCVDAAAGPILGERTPAPHPFAHSAASHAPTSSPFFFPGGLVTLPVATRAFPRSLRGRCHPRRQLHRVPLRGARRVAR